VAITDHYRYLDMLQQFLIPQLDEDDQEGRIHFQEDGAHPHYLGEVREYLSSRFPGRWTGRAAPIAWPPRSPDLTSLDFFSYGDSLTITIPGRTRCVLLHYDSSKHCTYPLNKFMQALKIVKLFLKQPVLPMYNVAMNRKYPS
jgi:hypothetical protein